MKRNSILLALILLMSAVTIITGNSVSQTLRKGISRTSGKSRSTRKYDIAAFYWPNYHYDSRLEFLFPDKKGEWQTIWNAKPKKPGEYQPRVPLWGYQNEAAPRVMNEKINAAVTHGVNVFIFDWYWYDDKPLLEACLDNGFLRVNHGRMRFYIMWANHDATSYWDRRDSDKTRIYWRGSVNRTVFDTIVNRMIGKYFTRPSYYKIGGKPVFAIYHLDNFIKGLGGAKAAREALEYFRKRTIEAGFPGLHLQAIMWAAVPSSLPGVSPRRVHTQSEVLSYFGFNSFTNYTWAHLEKPQGDYDKWANKSTSIWKTYSKEFRMPYFPNVSAGWDNNPRYPSSTVTPYIRNCTPKKFKKYLIKAKEYVNRHRLPVKLIIINAWNEWAEGSYLEPDKRFGYGYLDAVKQVFGSSK